jgi:hypothetical protein
MLHKRKGVHMARVMDKGPVLLEGVQLIAKGAVSHHQAGPLSSPHAASIFSCRMQQADLVGQYNPDLETL